MLFYNLPLELWDVEDIDASSEDGHTLKSTDSEQLWLEEDNIIIIVHPCAMVSSPGQCIWLAHALFRFLVQQKVKVVEVGQIQGPLSLIAIELLYHPKVLEVLVVSPNFKLVLCILKRMPPLLKGLNDSKHLLIVDLVVLLNSIQAL
ncbi:hypothetical protein C0995_002637 [Termitomyces sp. Mi166|nr:hypothetical protein C0995_002637 [Termitomyces sp. Mi166\